MKVFSKNELNLSAITSGLTQPSTWVHLALFSNLERQHRQKLTPSFMSRASETVVRNCLMKTVWLYVRSSISWHFAHTTKTDKITTVLMALVSTRRQEAFIKVICLAGPATRYVSVLKSWPTDGAPSVYTRRRFTCAAKHDFIVAVAVAAGGNYFLQYPICQFLVLFIYLALDGLVYIRNHYLPPQAIFIIFYCL